MKRIFITSAIILSLACCNDQEDNSETPVGNSDSVGATGANPGTGVEDTTTIHTDSISNAGHHNKADTIAPQ